MKAGKVGTLGKTTRHADNPSEADVDDKNFYLTEVDVTEVVAKQGWTLKKPLEAKMTSSMVGNLPEPVMIFKVLGKGGKVVRRNATLSPNVLGGVGGEESESELNRAAKKQHHHYGNLLDNYLI